GAEEEGGDLQLVVDPDGDASFAGAVKLGDDETVERAGLVKFLGLLEGVAAGGGIDDEQREVRRGGVLLGERAADFPQLLHQVVAGVDAAGGIADEEFRAGGDGFLMSVETDGGG